MILRNPQALYLLGLLLLFVIAWFWRRGRLSGAVLALRLLIASLLVLALADPVIIGRATSGQTLVLLVDQSDSLGDAGKAALRQQADQLASQSGRQSNNGTLHVVYFGANVATANPTSPNQQPALRADQTDIASALRTARGLIGPGGGRVMLLSDGQATRGDALSEARLLAQRGIPLDTMPYITPAQPEVWLQRVEAPPTLRVGESYTVQLLIGATEPTTARVQLYDGESLVQDQEEVLLAGENSFSYRQNAVRPGVAQLRAVVLATPDTIERNNSAAATALVAPPPRILLVEGRPGEAQPFREALQRAGIESEAIAATELPAQLSQLDAYEGLVLMNVPAGDLTLDQMTTMREFVRSEGRGLLVTGGRASFTLGGYKGTPLEEVLPVEMTPPPRPERSQVTLLLIADKSASMGVPENPSKFDLAKESAILAVEELREGDRIGVLAFDTNTEWVVNFQDIGVGLSKVQVQDQISRLGMGGGTDIYGALSVGLTRLADQPGELRHVVLLTDGRSFNVMRDPYRALLERARALNITVSSIAIGDDADTSLLQDLAQMGAGRYHFAATPQDIPRLTLLESEIARTEPQVEGEFRADLAVPHPLLREVSADQLPVLGGYVATTVKPEAELVLRSPEEDPVLAVWQYGLGRAVAWTPSVDAPWAEAWRGWPEYGNFWAQLIRYTLPEPDSGALRVRAQARGDTVTISADALAPTGAPLDLADTEATVTLPDGSTRELALRQTAPGHYETIVTLAVDGPYAIEVRQRKDALTRAARAGYVQSYSAEYLPATGGATLLAELSQVTGGQLLDGSTPAPALAGADASQPVELWIWLLLLALLLWPLEIALQRGWLRR